MKHTARIAGLAFLGLVVAISLAKLSSATGTINKGDLSGPWQVTLYGQGGCGVGTTQANFTLNTAGVGTATSKSHSVGCGDRGQWQWNRRPHLRRGMRVYLHDSGIAGSLDVQPGGYDRSQ